MRRYALVIVYVFILMLFVSCSGSQSTVLVTGETLDALGKQYLETAQLFDRLFAAKRISSQEYARWSAFAKQFPISYRAAVAAWKSGQEQQSADTMLALKNQLRDFLIFALERSS